VTGLARHRASGRIDYVTYYDIDAYLTDLGWVARIAQLNRFGEDEVVYKADLGFQDETEDAALRRGARWVLSKGGRVRVVMRAGAPVPSAPYVAVALT
jgi:hypothetical protein